MNSETTVMERLSAAMTSGDLTHKPKLCDVDFLGALGMAGIHHKHGSALLHLDLTLSSDAVREARNVTTQIVRKVCELRGWTLTPRKLLRISQDSLRHYMHPACNACHGRGFIGLELLPGSKAERVRPCEKCRGSGKEPIPLKYRSEIKAVLYVMEYQRRVAGGDVRKRMRIRADIE